MLGLQEQRTLLELTKGNRLLQERLRANCLDWADRMGLVDLLRTLRRVEIQTLAKMREPYRQSHTDNMLHKGVWFRLNWFESIVAHLRFGGVAPTPTWPGGAMQRVIIDA